MLAHHHKKKDSWNKLNMFSEFNESTINTGFWVGSFLNLFVPGQRVVLGLSLYAAIPASVIGLYSGVGSAISHGWLNAFLSSPMDLHNHHCDHSHHESEGVDKPLLENHGENAGDAHELTGTQRFYLLGDWLAHAGDAAAPIVFIAALAARHDELTGWREITLQVAAAVWGIIVSHPDKHSCEHAAHGHHHAPKPEELGWIRLNIEIGALNQFIAKLINIAFWFASIAQVLIGGRSILLGLSALAIAIGMAIAIGPTVGAVVSYWVLHNNMQCREHKHTLLNGGDVECAQHESSKPVDDHVQLTSWQKFYSLGNWIAKASDSAGPLMFLVALATVHQDGNKWVNLSLQIPITLFAFGASYAPKRAAETAMIEENRINQLMNFCQTCP